MTTKKTDDRFIRFHDWHEYAYKCPLADASHVRIDIARKMQAQGLWWRDRAREALGDLGKQVEHAGVQMIRAERLEDAIRSYHIAMTGHGFVDSEMRKKELAKLMEVVE